MRPAAQVGEGAVGVQRHGLDALVADQVLDQLDLVVLLLCAKAVERLGYGHLLAHERLVGVDVLLHPRLDPLEVGVGDRDPGRELEVVVEAVLDRRADRDLDPRVEVEHGRREYVRGVVADQGQGVLAAALGDDLELLRGAGAVGQRAREVAQLVVRP